MIDDTLRKMRELPHNVLVVPPFEEDAVKKGTDDIMDYVKVYLDMLLDEEVRTSLDVRETPKRGRCGWGSSKFPSLDVELVASTAWRAPLRSARSKTPDFVIWILFLSSEVLSSKTDLDCN